MPTTRRQQALMDAADAQEESPAPGSSAKSTTTRKRKAGEKASAPTSKPDLVANTPAGKNKPRAKRAKQAVRKKAESKATVTSEGDGADGPAKGDLAVTLSKATESAPTTMADVVKAGKATTTTPRKYFPASPSEKRPRDWLEEPPKAFLERATRAKKEKMFVVNHKLDQVGNVPVVSFDILGTTGNLYKTSIGKVPRCDCPDSRFRKGSSQCKHIIYVLVNVLKAPEELQFQMSFLPSELSGIFAASPLHQIELASPVDVDNVRKPIEDACPICFMDFDPSEEVTWCKTGCGNNVHKLCFDKWISTNKASGAAVRCVYCRTPWQFSNSRQNIQNLRESGQRNKLGYVNVAEQFGISPTRVKKPPSPSA
ncbi:hypothetical protein N7499_012573 [Penicillium canescens]|nr:hypothetical protein N7499_012573 [Penicillium canescens]KAJ6154613.1 hypothetical protein N7485_012982 [Penicillium canescens]